VDGYCILPIGNVACARGDVRNQSAIRITRNGFNHIMRGRFAHRCEAISALSNDFERRARSTNQIFRAMNSAT
jgi:hypothetical protein